jgi:hypothetical protein
VMPLLGHRRCGSGLCVATDAGIRVMKEGDLGGLRSAAARWVLVRVFIRPR